VTALSPHPAEQVATPLPKICPFFADADGEKEAAATG